MSDAPTIYFPNVAYEIGEMKPGRIWKTEINSSPGGQRQKRSLMPYGLRGFQAKIWVDDGTAVYLGGLATLEQFEGFLNQLRGEWGTFWIFNPKARDFTAALSPRETNVGLFDTTFPMIVPSKGGTITNIYVEGILQWTTGQFTQDETGPGGETRIATVDTGVNPLPADGQRVTVDIINSHDRFAACLVGDIEQIDPDFEAADPGWRYVIKVQEELVNL